ncbi:MAG: alpha-L-fucosidase [Bacteroidales bacterium]|nr:alpha-L-fucosidase [Bacteroidales bacterium]
MKGLLAILLSAVLPLWALQAQNRSLKEVQQDFVDLRFGMFIHYNIPTYTPEDWPDPDTPAEVFNPTKLDCRQWARAAKSANMTYGCLTTKHHSGFCIWDTRTTDYNVMNSPYGKDVVRQFVDAFRAEGLKVMLYYSILDTHHRLRPGYIVPEHVDMVKAQMRELLTNYGEISAIIIDGWDAPWSRISYDEIPFEEIYALVKEIQPECLLMDLNAAKYPAEGMFYTDIKSYEQNAGQHISKETNTLPALSCMPIQKTWFWKEYMPTTPVKDPKMIVEDNIRPMKDVFCNFILNVAPNRDGLMDDNALEALKQIGKMWKKEKDLPVLGEVPAPFVSSNLAKGKRVESSWSYDCDIMDLANDDSFRTAWVAHPLIENPFLTVYLGSEQAVNAVSVTQKAGQYGVKDYTLEYRRAGEWHKVADYHSEGRVKIMRFPAVVADAIRFTVKSGKGSTSGTAASGSEEVSGHDFVTVAEIGIYNERLR